MIIISARLPEIQGWPKVGSGNTGNEEINEEMRGMQLAGIPVIPVIIIGVMRISYNERAVSEGRFRHHLFQAVFVQMSYPSRYMYSGGKRVHTAVKNADT